MQGGQDNFLPWPWRMLLLGTSHYAVNKSGHKEGHVKDGQLTPSKQVSKRREIKYGLLSKCEVTCPDLGLPRGHRTTGTSCPKRHPLQNKHCPVRSITFEVCVACRQRDNSLGTFGALCAVTRGRPYPLGQEGCSRAVMVFARWVSEDRRNMRS